MKLYLCDDELKMREEIAARVSAGLPEADVCAFSGGGELLQQLKEEVCDILLLDIDMPELSGMEVARQLGKLPKKPLLIFVTGHDELVYESFQYHLFVPGDLEYLPAGNRKPERTVLLERQKICRISGKYFP